MASEPNGDGSGESIEVRCFSAALICLEGHYSNSPPMGPLTSARVFSMVSKTLEKTHSQKHVREALSWDVAIWIWLTRIFAAAVPDLTMRSVGPLSEVNDPDKGVTSADSTTLMIENYASLREDLQMLNKLMHIARNLLVTTEPEIPQDICAAVHFDQMVYQTIILCVNVTGKGYDGDVVDGDKRKKLNEITEIYKKLLVTCLQMAHNWTAKSDRNKMSFWLDVLFDEEGVPKYNFPALGENDETIFQPAVCKEQVQHWLERNSRVCDKARKLLVDYAARNAADPPGVVAPISSLAWNWLPEGVAEAGAHYPKEPDNVTPIWLEDEKDSFERDRRYGRVSREVDTWWLRARDPNYERWVVGMTKVETAEERTRECIKNLVDRYGHTCTKCTGELPESDCQHPAPAPESVYGYEDDEEEDDGESYVEGPVVGMLTEIPNVLDPKQIEALHMIVKSCVLDSAGSELTKSGESLSKTRCRMFLALDCGKTLLREMLVYIAVWEKDDESLIFQITCHIVEALHHSALIPHAWETLRLAKDIISPAQTVLLRLVNHMFRTRMINQATQDANESAKDMKLLHYFYRFFRSRIVPECVAMMHLQAHIRDNNIDPIEFPVDSWDMDRAKDGLAQYLDFLTTAAEALDTRTKMIEWEAVYDFISLLNGLEVGVPKKPLVEVPNRKLGPRDGAANSLVERPYTTETDSEPSSPSHHVLHDAHKYPWSGIKAQIFTIIATLIQPPPGRSSPGNPDVQKQMVRFNGIVPLLNCCAYDDHNPFAKERVTLCLKWLLDGCDEAHQFLTALYLDGSRASHRQGPDGVRSVRIDGIGGEVKVKVKGKSAESKPAPTTKGETGAGASKLDNKGSGADVPNWSTWAETYADSFDDPP